MKKLFVILSLSSGLYAMAQEEQPLPDNLQIAVKQNWNENELKPNIPDNLHKESKLISFNEDIQEIKENMSGNFYEVFADEYQNIYRKDSDPTLTTMPPPGPNLDYWCLPWQ